MSNFNLEKTAKTLATQATSYTVGGVPVIIFGCFGITAGLIGTMMFYEGDNQKEEKPAALETPEKSESETETETETETPDPEQSGGGKKKKKKKNKRRTRRKNKRKQN